MQVLVLLLSLSISAIADIEEQRMGPAKALRVDLSTKKLTQYCNLVTALPNNYNPSTSKAFKESRVIAKAFLPEILKNKDLPAIPRDAKMLVLHHTQECGIVYDYYRVINGREPVIMQIYIDADLSGAQVQGYTVSYSLPR